MAKAPSITIEINSSSPWQELTPLVCQVFRELLEHPDPMIRLKTARTVMELKLDFIARA